MVNVVVTRRIKISISALSSKPSDRHKRLAQRLISEVLKLLEKNECEPVFYIGGYSGLMKDAVDILVEKNSGLKIIAILPIEYEEHSFPPNVIPVYTGMSFQNRNPILVRSGDFLLALGGGAGSIMEIYNAVALGRNVLLLVNTGMPSDFLHKSFRDGVIDPLRSGRVAFVDMSDNTDYGKLEHFIIRECEKALRVK